MKKRSKKRKGKKRKGKKKILDIKDGWWVLTDKSSQLYGSCVHSLV